MAEQPCVSCRQVVTEDPTGLCEDCMTDVPSGRPGSITDTQVWAILDGMQARGMAAHDPATRLTALTAALPEWRHGGSLRALSQAQAIDVLDWLGRDGQG